MASTERGQSEVIGTVLLIGVVVVAMTTFGSGLLASVSTGEDVHVDVRGSVTTDRVELRHAGGDSLATAQLTVVVRDDDGTARYDFADGSLSGSTPDTFDPGEAWTRSASFATGEEVRVLLVHGGIDSVLFEGWKLAAPTTTTATTTVPGTTTGTPTATTGTPTATTTATPTATTTPAPTTSTTTPAPTTTTTEPNDPPTADFTFSCPGWSCSFDATASDDPDGTVVSYVWTFGDGTIATGATPNHTYAANGTYPVTLTVSDDDGATDTVERDVAVTEYPPSVRTLRNPTYDHQSDEFRIERVAVGDRNGNLRTVEISVEDSAGAVVAERNVSVQGGSSYAEDGLVLPADAALSPSETYTVYVNVTDAMGRTGTASAEASRETGGGPPAAGRVDRGDRSLTAPWYSTSVEMYIDKSL